MKKLIVLFLAVLFILTAIIPQSVSAYEDPNVASNVVYVSYNEFNTNRDYYDLLVLQGYGVCVSFGNDYTDSEIQALLGLAPVTEENQQVRGTSRPKDSHNVHINGRKDVKSDAEYDIIYSNVKYTGCTFHLITLFNYDYYSTLAMRVYGTSSGTQDYYLPPRSYMYQPIHTNSSTDEFFLAFSPPSHTDGYVECCPAS